jgi:transcriptional regulator with XRE-family HTH domain
MPSRPKEEVISKKAIGDRIRALRQAQDLSQGRLAQALGIPSTNVSAIERGVRGVSVHQLVKLAKALDVSPGEILNGHGSTRSKSTAPGRLPRRIERISKLPRTKRRVLYEIIDAFLDRHESA